MLPILMRSDGHLLLPQTVIEDTEGGVGLISISVNQEIGNILGIEAVTWFLSTWAPEEHGERNRRWMLATECVSIGMWWPLCWSTWAKEKVGEKWRGNEATSKLWSVTLSHNFDDHEMVAEWDIQLKLSPDSKFHSQ